MGTLLQSTLNTRALPTGNLHYIRSDYPGKLTDQELTHDGAKEMILVDDVENKEFLRELVEAMYALSDVCEHVYGYVSMYL